MVLYTRVVYKVTRLALKFPLNETRVKWQFRETDLFTCLKLQRKPQRYQTLRVLAVMVNCTSISPQLPLKCWGLKLNCMWTWHFWWNSTKHPWSMYRCLPRLIGKTAWPVCKCLSGTKRYTYGHDGVEDKCFRRPATSRIRENVEKKNQPDCSSGPLSECLNNIWNWQHWQRHGVENLAWGSPLEKSWCQNGSQGPYTRTPAKWFNSASRVRFHTQRSPWSCF